MKIYLASSWRNAYQPEVLAQLRAAGHEVYDFRNPAPGNEGFSWKQIDPDLKSDLSAARLRRVLAHPIAEAGFKCDFDAMKWADACVLLLPCGSSAHLEAGWMSGQGKPVAIFAPEIREPELMVKVFDDDVGGTPLFDEMNRMLAHLGVLFVGCARCGDCNHTLLAAEVPAGVAYVCKSCARPEDRLAVGDTMTVTYTAVASERDALQATVASWAVAAFGQEATSVRQRALRLLEESIEAFQAANGDPQQARALVDFVFSRPVGDVRQEVAQVSVCAMLLAGAAGVSLDAQERAEVARILAKPPEHFTARNAAKNAAGFKAT